MSTPDHFFAFRGSATVPEPGPRLWIRVDLEGDRHLGPGKIALLKAVDEHRSISAAARALGMSYRRAWLLLDETGTVLGRPVVETTVGGARQGGASLTEAGRLLVERFEALERAARSATQGELAALALLASGN